VVADFHKSHLTLDESDCCLISFTEVGV